MSSSDRSEPAVELSMRYIPYEVDRWDVVEELAKILHLESFPQPRAERKLNFEVFLYPSQTGSGHNGSGTLRLPSRRVGNLFMNWVKVNPIKMGAKGKGDGEGRANGEKKGKQRKILFHMKETSVPEKITAILQKAPWVDPKKERDREERVFRLEQEFLRVRTVQFGVLFRPEEAGRTNAKGWASVHGGAAARPKSREYSIEWERNYIESQGWLKFEFDHKLIRIELGDRLSEQYGSVIVINFASISKIAVGNEYGYGSIIFDTHTPPILEEVDFHRPMTGQDREDSSRYKRRIGSLDRHAGHERVAPFAQKLRLLMHNGRLDSDVIQDFIRLCQIAQLQPTVIPVQIIAAGHKFFSQDNLRKIRAYTKQCEWGVAFQLESLLHNTVLHALELMELFPVVDEMRRKHGNDYTAEFLKKYNEVLNEPERPPTESFRACFERVKAKFVSKEKKLSQTFGCYHIIFTPTRMILEGPYATDSNRIIRRYAGYEGHFIRVAFCDEDRMRLRWDREVDGRSFLQERIGGILKTGFELAGRSFEFLAYSTSALRDHSVWFMNPFRHHDPNIGVVTAEKIRDSIGDFHVQEEPKDGKVPLLWCPSKYAARIAQAFTATERSVRIREGEWNIMPDLGSEPYLFTDGVGTISESLGDEIWAALCAGRQNRGEHAIKPSAYQIRFLGFKGVVVVDRELDRIPGSKLRMRLRPSMRKFENSTEVEADIEIAEAFERPMASYFNKALVMILEDRGVRRDVFLNLLRAAVADANLLDNSLAECHQFFASHGFGNGFHLPWILEQLAKHGAEIVDKCNNSGLKTNELIKSVNIDNHFLKLLRNVARMQVLREIKHDARIPIPESHLLVGVADEGPSYEGQPGYEDAFFLKEGQIFACIQRPGEPEPTWIEGACLIWRSPLVHPGDIQRVYAIGKPPSGVPCMFAHLKNVVVLPSKGRRSLASCLGGGDYDGDTFSITTFNELLPHRHADPASYEAGGDFNLERESTIEDVCDFVVEYFNSDVIGLLSDRLLVIADQSEEGFFDPNCKALAELCSQAVDYPKKGIPVDISGLPRTLIRSKPDWHAAEVVNPRKTDYYDSSRALGHMYREITLADRGETEKLTSASLNGQARNSKNHNNNSEDPISSLIRKDVLAYLQEVSAEKIRPESTDKDINLLFQTYVDGLRYICATHTLSNEASVRLIEEEVVLGVILANCSERRWRKERMYRMRLHASTLVKETKAGFQPFERAEETIADREGLIYVLGKAWEAWKLSLREEVFGANSFGLIALGSVLNCLEKLSVM